MSLFTIVGDEGVDAGVVEEPDGCGCAGHAEFFGGTYAREARHPLPGISPVSTTEQVGVPGPWWNRLAHFKLDFTPSHGDEVQTEYLLPRGNALAAIDALRALGPRIAPHLFIAELRTVAADDLWLSTAYHQHSVGFHFTWKKHAEALAVLLPDIEAALAPLGARPHWGKVFVTDPGRFEALYPQLPAFRNLAERVDPEHKFRNDYLDRNLFAAAAHPAEWETDRMAKTMDWREMREWEIGLLEKATGQGLEHWNARVLDSGIQTEHALRTWLTEQGVTGYPRMLLVMERFGYPDFLLATSDELVDGQYCGPAAVASDLRPAAGGRRRARRGHGPNPQDLYRPGRAAAHIRADRGDHQVPCRPRPAARR